MGSVGPTEKDERQKVMEQGVVCEESRKEKFRVLLTGFGPFGSHEVNASIVTAKYLAKYGICDDVQLFTYEIPVVYDTVTQLVPELWEKHKPHLVVHTGVSSVAKELTLEHRAHNHGYFSCDVSGCKPLNHCCIPVGSPGTTGPASGGSSAPVLPLIPSSCCSAQPEHSPPPASLLTAGDGNPPPSINTGLDVWKVAHCVNQQEMPVPTVVSSDAGRYLCEFIYYTSLHLGRERSVFVHVPVLGRPYSLEDLATTMRAIILALVEQVREMKNRKKKTETIS